MGRVTRGLDDAALLDRVAQATATYFTDWSHPSSGMARERSAGAFGYDVEDTVTTGGTGFGLMAQIVSAERGWRPRCDILDRVERILGFLEGADRFGGVLPHFLSGASGRVLAFMPGDDGGDLVETAFLMLGLLAAAEFFAEEPELGARIEALFDAVEWSAHLRDGALQVRIPMIILLHGNADDVVAGGQLQGVDDVAAARGHLAHVLGGRRTRPPEDVGL